MISLTVTAVLNRLPAILLPYTNILQAFINPIAMIILAFGIISLVIGVIVTVIGGALLRKKNENLKDMQNEKDTISDEIQEIEYVNPDDSDDESTVEIDYSKE